MVYHSDDSGNVGWAMMPARAHLDVSENARIVQAMSRDGESCSVGTCFSGLRELMDGGDHGGVGSIVTGLMESE